MEFIKKLLVVRLCAWHEAKLPLDLRSAILAWWYCKKNTELNMSNLSWGICPHCAAKLMQQSELYRIQEIRAKRASL